MDRKMEGIWVWWALLLRVIDVQLFANFLWGNVYAKSWWCYYRCWTQSSANWVIILRRRMQLDIAPDTIDKPAAIHLLALHTHWHWHHWWMSFASSNLGCSCTIWNLQTKEQNPIFIFSKSTSVESNPKSHCGTHRNQVSYQLIWEENWFENWKLTFCLLTTTGTPHHIGSGC